MRTSTFDYSLPPDRIAHAPREPRDHSKLMVINRETGTVTHQHFFDITDHLCPGDVLVLNNSKVFKARLYGTLVSPTGRVLHDRLPVEIFLIRPTENIGMWKALGYKGRRIKPGMKIVFSDHAAAQFDTTLFWCDVVLKEPDGTLLIQFPYDADRVRDLANMYGHIPLPEYIENEQVDIDRYQTIFAKEDAVGSVAAPTAGFHFTEALLERLKEKGVIVIEVTLHVGLGTFIPVKTELIHDHTMHSEWVEVTEEAAKIVNAAKAEGRRVIAVGTTSTRTIEAVAGFHKSGQLHAYTGDVDIFIAPGFEFQVVDALITNFHLPKTTLLMLVSSFIGNIDVTLQCYAEAVDREYRFYSFGDAMLIV